MDCGDISCSGSSWKYGYSIYLLRGTIDIYGLTGSAEWMEEGNGIEGAGASYENKMYCHVCSKDRLNTMSLRR